MQRDRKLKAGVVGVGSMGQNHARILSQMNNVELVGFAETDPATRDRMTARLRAPGYASFGEMLDAEKPDFVTVALPTIHHYGATMAALNAGVHVLVEKPIALNVDEAEEMIALAERKGLLLGVGHVERFNPVVSACAKWIDEDKLGRIYQITIRRIGPFPTRVMDVGVILDLGSHDIDLLCHLSRSGVHRFAVETSRRLHQSHDDLAIAMFRFDSGIIGLIVENWLTPTKTRDLVINGERGMLVADMLTQDLFFYENQEATHLLKGGAGGMAIGNMIRYNVVREEPLRIELSAFADAVAGGSAFSVDGRAGLEALKIARRLIDLAAEQGNV